MSTPWATTAAIALCVLILVVAPRRFNIFHQYLHPWLDRNANRVSQYASLIGIVSMLSIAVGVAETCSNNAERLRQEKLQLAAAQVNHASLMAGLGTELINNIQLCNVFLSEAESYRAGRGRPRYQFVFLAVDEVLSRAVMRKHELRAGLLDLRIQLESANLTLRTLYASATAPVTSSASPASKEYGREMDRFLNQVQKIRDKTSALQEEFDDYWSRYSEYESPVYLREKLIPEALIK